MTDLNLLFVCKGNICRSPFASALCSQVLLKDFPFLITPDSKGTENYHVGKPAHLTAIEVAKYFGVDLSRHIAHVVSREDVKNSSIIVFMDSSNITRLNSLFPDEVAGKKVIKLWDYSRKALTGIPDPYKGIANDFKDCFELIFESCESMIGDLKLI